MIAVAYRNTERSIRTRGFKPRIRECPRRREAMRREPLYRHEIKRDRLISMVATWHGLTIRDLKNSSRRESHIVAARADAIEAVYRLCRIEGQPYSVSELSRRMNLDRASVLSTLRKRGLKK